MANWLQKHGITPLGINDRQGGLTAPFRHAVLLEAFRRQEILRLENKAAAMAAGTYSHSADRTQAHQNWVLWVRACHVIDMDPGEFSANDNQPLKAAS